MIGFHEIPLMGGGARSSGVSSGAMFGGTGGARGSRKIAGARSYPLRLTGACDHWQVSSEACVACVDGKKRLHAGQSQFTD